MRNDNFKIAKIFEQIAGLLELSGDNPFRIRAYRKGAEAIGNLDQDVKQLVKKKALTEISGIGKELAIKIEEFLSTGKIEALEELNKKVSPVVIELMSIPGVGPKTAILLVERLGIKSIAELEQKAKEHMLSTLPGLKSKTEENILKGIEFVKKSRERLPLVVAELVAEDIIDKIKNIKGLRDVECVGSIRRRKERVKNINILVCCDDVEKFLKKCSNLFLTEKVTINNAGNTGNICFIYKGKILVEITAVLSKEYAGNLVYLTGSTNHNKKLSVIAKEKGVILNGTKDIYKNSLTGHQDNNNFFKAIKSSNEEQVYKRLGLNFIAPELREDRGEIEASLENKLPDLVTIKDIKGDCHMHSNQSDGFLSIEELVYRAQQKGYEYIVITDHSTRLAVADGLTKEQVLNQIEDIRSINDTLKDFYVLAGAEVDILKDGELDYEDEILSKLDFVFASIHSHFNIDKKSMTKRIVKAIENKYVTCIAHPTGRLMGVRGAYDIDFDLICKVAKETNTALEINSYPYRLDMTDINCLKAKQAGIKMIISTDAHSAEHLDNMRFGVDVARRGWLEPKDILNTLPYEKFIKQIKKR